MKLFNLLTAKRVLVLIALFAFLIALVPPLIAAAPPQQTGQITYYVQPGDTLFSISRRFGTTVPLIMQANNLTTESIYVGQRLLVPFGAPASPTIPLPPFTCKYTVANRDTFFSIAYRYGIPVSALMQANNVYSPNVYYGYYYRPMIFVGQQLNVPCNTPQPTPFPTYTVQTGDNLFRLAIKYETSIYAIALVNGIPNPHIVYAGQNLIMPYPGTVKWPPVPTVTPTGTLLVATTGPGTPTVTPSPTPTTSATSTTPSVVIMQNIMFLPNPVTIPRGTAVQWKNQDATTHTVTSGTPGNISGLFRSGNLTTGQTFSFTFTTAGTFPYFCEIHGAQMTGTVTVQ